MSLVQFIFSLLHLSLSLTHSFCLVFYIPCCLSLLSRPLHVSLTLTLSLCLVVYIPCCHSPSRSVSCFTSLAVTQQLFLSCLLHPSLSFTPRVSSLTYLVVTRPILLSLFFTSITVTHSLFLSCHFHPSLSFTSCVSSYTPFAVTHPLILSRLLLLSLPLTLFFFRAFYIPRCTHSLLLSRLVHPSQSSTPVSLFSSLAGLHSFCIVFYISLCQSPYPPFSFFTSFTVTHSLLLSCLLHPPLSFTPCVSFFASLAVTH